MITTNSPSSFPTQSATLQFGGKDPYLKPTRIRTERLMGGDPGRRERLGLEKTIRLLQRNKPVEALQAFQQLERGNNVLSGPEEDTITRNFARLTHDYKKGLDLPSSYRLKPSINPLSAWVKKNFPASTLKQAKKKHLPASIKADSPSPLSHASERSPSNSSLPYPLTLTPATSFQMTPQTSSSSFTTQTSLSEHPQLAQLFADTIAECQNRKIKKDASSGILALHRRLGAQNAFLQASGQETLPFSASDIEEAYRNQIALARQSGFRHSRMSANPFSKTCR